MRQLGRVFKMWSVKSGYLLGWAGCCTKITHSALHRYLLWAYFRLYRQRGSGMLNFYFSFVVCGEKDDF